MRQTWQNDRPAIGVLRQIMQDLILELQTIAIPIPRSVDLHYILPLHDGRSTFIREIELGFGALTSHCDLVDQEELHKICRYQEVHIPDRWEPYGCPKRSGASLTRSV
jgi:hypothetical protein